MTDAAALTAAETEAAAALLSAAWGERAGSFTAQALPDRSHVFRLSLGGRSAVLKRRDTGDETGRFGIELATLAYLNGMPVPVAPRLLGADAGLGIMVMEDLGPGPSLADAMLTGRRDQAQDGLAAYARALGTLHAWSRDRAGELAALQDRYAPGARREPAWLGAISRGRAAFLGAAAALGLATEGLDGELDALGPMMNGAGHVGLVHSDACPDNVRLSGGSCRFFDFETSGWGPVVLDAAYLLAPFPSCWCFARLPGDVAAAALAAYRDQVGAAGIELGPDWDAALAAAVAGWIVARGEALAEALGEDSRWGTTTVRPRLLAWLRSFAAAAGQAGVLPRLRALASELGEVLIRRWPEISVPEYPALAGPGAVLAQVPDWRLASWPAGGPAVKCLACPGQALPPSPGWRQRNSRPGWPRSSGRAAARRGGGRGPRRRTRLVRRHRVRGTGHRDGQRPGHALRHRVDHQDVHRDGDHAAA